MGRKIGSQFECEICGEQTTVTGGKQRTCKSHDCQLKLRSKTRKGRYYEQRDTPICVWCEEPIHEPRKRKYHAECREDKNRERVRDYYQAGGPSDPSRPKKARTFKGKVTCKFCRKRVKRTGARQIICKERECVNALKAERKRQAKARKRRLAEVREKKLRKFSKEKVELHHHRVMV